MKSIQNFITEAKNKVTFDYDESPNWGTLTVGVDYMGEPVIIFGEPASRSNQDAWQYAYDLASKLDKSSVRWISNNIEDAFESLEEDMGLELDEQQCLCICWVGDAFTVYVYGPDGVEAIK